MMPKWERIVVALVVSISAIALIVVVILAIVDRKPEENTPHHREMGRTKHRFGLK